ncbi:MAG: bifunctional DNA-formamidopyrimidine glycosylase/DNA-(apurinic or apyrimidinic site) lyase [Gammaproteobacteria bacterium]|nr:bifunctional DNA-formamidopyrimidine glycosylase/DNA-(apurinic or apyrimidinic site) lyase [Gammaproteobacteria bacterium]
MPELPEVETMRRGIEPHILNETIITIIVRERRLRWPVSKQFDAQAPGSKVQQVQRRSKYLLVYTSKGCIILHLGMSGSLRILDVNTPAEKHDHVDIVFSNNKIIRFRDPRRFGSVFWTRADPLKHKLLIKLGPEPLDEIFCPELLFKKSRGRKQNIKTFIMNSQIVVGVGNIYACESLFLAGIHPTTAAGKISKKRLEILVETIKDVLNKAIKKGGTTLKDFTQADGNPGYFAQSLNVYGRESEPCNVCKKPVKKITQCQRSTFYCPACQR